MDDAQWEELAKSDFKKESTPVLRALAAQYADLRSRIEAGHKETLETPNGEPATRRSLRSEELVIEELKRRGEI